MAEDVRTPRKLFCMSCSSDTKKTPHAWVAAHLGCPSGIAAAGTELNTLHSFPPTVLNTSPGGEQAWVTGTTMPLGKGNKEE